VFLNLPGAAKGALIRAAAPTQPLGRAAWYEGTNVAGKACTQASQSRDQHLENSQPVAYLEDYRRFL
jgi:hypothetical protein